VRSDAVDGSVSVRRGEFTGERVGFGAERSPAGSWIDELRSVWDNQGDGGRNWAGERAVVSTIPDMTRSSRRAPGEGVSHAAG